MKGYSPKFEGKRARIGGVREVSDFSANLEFSANLKVTLVFTSLQKKFSRYRANFFGIFTGRLLNIIRGHLKK